MADGRVEIIASLDDSELRSGLKGAEKEAKVSADKIAQAFQSAGDSMKTVGENLSKSLTLPLAAVTGASMLMAQDFVGAQGMIQASLGVSKDEAELLANASANITESWGGDMATVSDAVISVKKNLKDVDNTELTGVTEKALSLGKVLGEDVGNITQNVQKLATNMGVSYDEAFDLITAGAQRGLNKNGDLLDTINEYSPLMREAGFTADEFFSLLQAGTDAGARDTDFLADAFKEFGIRAQDGTEQVSDAFASIGGASEQAFEKFKKGQLTTSELMNIVIGDLEKMEDPMKANQLGVELFGTKWEDNGNKVMFALNDVENGYKDVTGASDEMNESVSKTQEMEQLLNGLKNTLIPLGIEFLKIAQEILPPVIEKLQELAGWFRGLSDEGKTVVTVIMAVGVAIGPVLTFIGTLITVVGKVLPILKNLKTAFTVIRTAMLLLTGPIGIVIAIITTLGVIIYKNWDSIAKWTSETWEKVKRLVVEKAVELSAKAIEKFQSLRDGARDRVETMKNWVIDKFSSLVTGAVSKGQEIKDRVTGKFDDLKNSARDKVTGMKDAVVGKLSEMVSSAQSKASDLYNKLTQPITKAKDFIKSQVDKIKGFFSGLSIKLPHIKLPHFSLSGKFSLAPPSVPKLNVNWYKKGGVFSDASIIGVGEEAGVSEAVIPLKDSVLGSIGESIAKLMPQNSGMGRGGSQIAQAIFKLGNREFKAMVELITEKQNDYEFQNSRKGRV